MSYDPICDDFLDFFELSDRTQFYQRDTAHIGKKLFQNLLQIDDGAIITFA